MTTFNKRVCLIVSNFPAWSDVEALARYVEVLATAHAHPAAAEVQQVRRWAKRRKYYRNYSRERSRK